MVACRRLIVSIVLCFSTAAVLAQNVTGKVVGTVTDKTGAVVEGAEVVVTRQATSLERKTHTDSTGTFTVDLLQPGQYSLSVEKQGFKRAVVPPFDLEVTQTARVDVGLELGSVSQSLEVTAVAPLVESETSSVGQVINTKEIQNLPLNGRDFFSLVLLSPGVSPTQPGSGIVSLHPVPGSLSFPAFNVAGAREQGTGYLIDGVDAQDPHVEVPSIYLSVDAIQEFRLETNAYSAEYGNHAAQVIIATRSGTNKFHSSLYEFVRNDALDAAGYFANLTATRKPELRYNQYGGTISGPVTLPLVASASQKTFYFLNYEGTRIQQGAYTQLTVPYPTQVSGNFSQIGQFGDVPIFDPATTTVVNGVTTRQQFPNNIIPSSRISTFGKGILALYPNPNLTVTTGNNYVSSLDNYSNSDQGLARIDHYFGEHDNAFFRYTVFTGALSNKSAVTNGGVTTNATTQNMGLNYIHIFNTNFVNEVRLGYNRPKYFELQDGAYGVNTTAALGIQNLVNVPAAYGNPLVTTTGYAAISVSDIYPSNQISNVYQLVEQLSLTHGKHSLKFGTDMRKLNYNDETEREARGDFSFTGGFTQNPASPSNTGMSLADLLLGLPLTASGSRTSLKGAFNGYNLGYYLQDDWNAMSRLTVNLGLRYDLNTRMVNAANHLTLFDRDYPGGRLLLAGTSQTYIPGIGLGSGPYTPSGLFPNNVKDWGPRVGIAFRPFADNRTAIRAGYGIFYAQIELQDLRTWLRNPPFGDITSVQSNQSGNSSSSTVFSTSSLFPASGSDLSQPQIYSANVKGAPDPYYQQWNLNIQRSAGAFLFEVGYIGSKGTKEAQRINVNQATLPTNLSNISPIQTRIPYPLFGSLIRVTSDEASSTYHALVAKVERHFTNGLSLLGSYTFSKSIDEASLIDDNARDVYDLKLDKGRADYDIRHNVVISGTYELPFGSHKAWLNKGSAAAVLGGWELNTVTAIHSGFPFSVSANGDACICGASPQLAQEVGNPLTGFQRSRLEWFNVKAFAQPTAGTIGSSGRNIIDAPGSFSMDASLFRVVNLAEHAQLELRLEDFNLPNHTNFGLPGTTIGTSTYGIITSSSAARAYQVGAKLVF